MSAVLQVAGRINVGNLTNCGHSITYWSSGNWRATGNRNLSAEAAECQIAKFLKICIPSSNWRVCSQHKAKMAVQQKLLEMGACLCVTVCVSVCLVVIYCMYTQTHIYHAHIVYMFIFHVAAQCNLVKEITTAVEQASGVGNNAALHRCLCLTAIL